MPCAVVQGITSCRNCSRVFDSSQFNRLLSASWLIRRQHVQSEEYLIQNYGYELWEAELLVRLVHFECYSQEEVVAFLKKAELSDYEKCIDLAS